MKKMIIAAMLAISMPAMAQEVCSKLDYSEMKDMPASELSAEYCRNMANVRKNSSGMIDAFSDGNSMLREAFGAAMTECSNQNRRIERILAQKSVTAQCR